MKRLAPELEHKDKRRILTQLITVGVLNPLRQVTIYEANHGAELGNHYHKETTEYFYVIRGVLLYNKTDYIKKGDLFFVLPLENHTLKVMSDKATFMTFVDRPYTKINPDIWRKE